MWRIHFTRDDLTRVRLAVGADPMVELAHSVQLIGNRAGEAVFGPWRRHARLTGADRWRALRTLTPPQGYFPDFLTPMTGTTELRDGIEAVLETPRTTLAQDLSRLGRGRSLPDWCGRLAHGELGALRGLGRLMHRYFHELLAPHWRLMRQHIDEELHRLIRVMARDGTEQMLSAASPLLRWESSTLKLTTKGNDVDVHLNGRGLVLLPSFFACGDTTPFNVPGMPVMLAYPVEHELGWFTKQASTGRAESHPLRTLLGHTRAQVLEVLAGRPRGTTELAARLDLAPASASQHAKALREAGLVSSAHQGRRVAHQASTLGVQLLERTR